MEAVDTFNDVVWRRGEGQPNVTLSAGSIFAARSNRDAMPGA